MCDRVVCVANSHLCGMCVGLVSLVWGRMPVSHGYTLPHIGDAWFVGPVFGTPTNTLLTIDLFPFCYSTTAPDALKKKNSGKKCMQWRPRS